jgi:putative SOS response-associated peptidase YedK
MTRLYRLDCTAASIAARFGARPGADPWAGGYVAPGHFAPVITAGRDAIAGPRPRSRIAPRIVPRLWGVLPPPAADDPARRIASVRNADSPFWIGNLRNSEFRCIVPASAFMLWGDGTDHEGRRLKHWFGPAAHSAPGAGGPAIMALAGVWKDEDVPAFALLTRTAHGAAAQSGATAMPVVLPPAADAHAAWLHGSWDRARDLIASPSACARDASPIAPLPDPAQLA